MTSGKVLRDNKKNCRTRCENVKADKFSENERTTFLNLF